MPQQREPGRRSGRQERQGAVVREGRGGGAAGIGNSLLWSKCMPTDLEVRAALRKLRVARSLLLLWGD